MYSLAVIIVYASITVFISLIYVGISTILTISLEKKTQISRFQFKKLSFCHTF